TTSLGAGLGAGLGLAGALAMRRAIPIEAADEQKHFIWVWEFAADAEPNVIGSKLRDNNLAVVIKTHDGVEWMSKYDKSRYAISGPAQVSTLASYFEQNGVPFHAWAVPTGVNPLAEAQMAASVLTSGARSLWLDVEPHSGFWQGSANDALTYG